MIFGFFPLNYLGHMLLNVFQYFFPDLFTAFYTFEILNNNLLAPSENFRIVL